MKKFNFNIIEGVVDIFDIFDDDDSSSDLNDDPIPDPPDPTEDYGSISETLAMPKKRKGQNYTRSFTRKFLDVWENIETKSMVKTRPIQPIKRKSKILEDKRTILLLVRTVFPQYRNDLFEKL